MKVILEIHRGISIFLFFFCVVASAGKAAPTAAAPKEVGVTAIPVKVPPAPVAAAPQKKPSCTIGETADTLMSLGQGIENAKAQCSNVKAITCYMKVKQQVKECLDKTPNLTLWGADAEYCANNSPAWRDVDPNIIDALKSGPGSCKLQLGDINSALVAQCKSLATFKMPACLAQVNRGKETSGKDAYSPYYDDENYF